LSKVNYTERVQSLSKVNYTERVHDFTIIVQCNNTAELFLDNLATLRAASTAAAAATRGGPRAAAAAAAALSATLPVRLAAND
jgi:hypothetical protein